MIALAIAALITNPLAADPKPWTVFGAGNMQCDRWTVAHKARSADYTMMLSWVGGFLSALNHESLIDAQVNLTDGTDMPASVEWLDAYCLANPNATIATATEQLSDTIRKQSER